MSEKNPHVPTFSEARPITATALKSLAAGGSIAAISAIISDILETRRQRAEEAKRKGKGISDDTVVLRVRKPSEKAAQACDGSCECNPAECDGEKTVGTECKVVPKVEPVTEEREIAYQGQGNQPRSKDGKYSTLGKVAQDGNPDYTSWGDVFFGRGGSGKGGGKGGKGGGKGVDFTWGQTLGKGLQIAAVPVFGTLGYFAVTALHKKLEENRLKRQLAAAQQEYIDLLSGKEVKTASAFSRAFLFDDERFVKSAADGEHSTLGNVLGWFGRQGDAVANLGNKANDTAKVMSAGAIAAMILTGGASAWLTHKVLASKFDKKDEDEEPRKVTKVMFKEFSDKSKELAETFPKLMFKSAEGDFEITPEQFLCTIQVLRGCIADSGFSKKAEDPAWLEGYNQLVNGTNTANAIISKMPLVGGLKSSQFTPEEFADAILGGGGMGSKLIRQVINSDPEKYGGTVEQLAAKIKAAGGLEGIRRAGYWVEGKKSGMTPELWQHALRKYVSDPENGGLEYKPSAGLDERLAGAMGSDDPAAVRAALLQQMQKDPKGWFNLLGAHDNAKVRDALLSNYFSKAGWFYNIPIIGDLAKWLGSSFMKNTQWGRRIMARHALMANGMTEEQANKYMENYDFSRGDGYGWVEKPQQPTEAPAGEAGAAGAKPPQPPPPDAGAGAAGAKPPPPPSPPPPPPEAGIPLQHSRTGDL